MKKHYLFLICGFFLALIIYNILTWHYIGWIDSGEYVSIAKVISGESVTGVRATHSWVYGIILAFFYKIFKNIIFLKLVNCIWLILTAFILYKLTKNAKVLLVFMFTPAIWYLANWVTPHFLVTLFFLLGYFYFKKYEDLEKIKFLILSGIFIGICCLIRSYTLPLFILFVLIFMYKKQLKLVFFYSIIVLGIYSFSFIIDWYLFGFPFYSLFREWGGVSLCAILRNANILKTTIVVLRPIEYLLYFLAIPPLTYVIIHKIYKRNIRLKLFVLISFLLYLPITPQIRYLIIITPLLAIVVGKYLKKHSNLLKLNIILSILFIPLVLAHPFLIIDDFKYNFWTDEIKEDFKQLADEYENEIFIAGNEDNWDFHTLIHTKYSGDKIKELIGWHEYNLWLQNKTKFHSYFYKSNSRFPNTKEIFLEFGAYRKNKDFSDVKYLIDVKKSTSLENFKFIKCYKKLCLFEKIN